MLNTGGWPLANDGRFGSLPAKSPILYQMKDTENYPKKDPVRFNGNVGRFLPAKEALARTKRFKQYKIEQLKFKPESFTKAEFFGSNNINKLLGHKECVGIRIYYGMTEEKRDDDISDGKLGNRNLTSRLVIVGVRADGTDIFEDPTGQKDIGDNATLGDGHECPQHCGRPPGALATS